MQINIKTLGLKAYLDRVYAEAGGYDRFIKLTEAGWPKIAIAKEFGVARQSVTHWEKVLKDGN